MYGKSVSQQVVDQALGRLAGKSTPADRFTILKTLVEYWHGPILPADGFASEELAGIALPAPLESWYRWAGKRNDILSGQDTLATPIPNPQAYSLKNENGYLFFHSENQGVWDRATFPRWEDPPVFTRVDERSPLIPEAVTLSEHLILICIFEAILGEHTSPYHASASCLHPGALEVVTGHLTRVALPAWEVPADTRFFYGNGAFACVMLNSFFKDGKNSECFTVFLGSKTSEALAFIKPHLDDTWESRELED